MADEGLKRAIRDLNAVHSGRMAAAVPAHGADRGLSQAIGDLNRTQARKMAEARQDGGQ